MLGFMGLVVVACKSPEAPVAVESSAGECPTAGERTCKESGDCGAGSHCTGGRCYANQAGCPCSNIGDCGARAHCTRGQCYANQAGSPCAAPDQCGWHAPLHRRHLLREHERLALQRLVGVRAGVGVCQQQVQLSVSPTL